MTVAGKYKRRGLLQSVTETRNAKSKQTTRAWSTDATLWMRADPVSGNERMVALQLAPEITHLVEMRYRDNVVPKQRILLRTAVTTLGASIDTVNETSITVAVAHPHDLDFLILVGTEEMRVTDGSGTLTWTVVRGENSSTAATHLDAVSVKILSIFEIKNVRDRELDNVEMKLECVQTELRE